MSIAGPPTNSLPETYRLWLDLPGTSQRTSWSASRCPITSDFLQSARNGAPSSKSTASSTLQTCRQYQNSPGLLSPSFKKTATFTSTAPSSRDSTTFPSQAAQSSPPSDVRRTTRASLLSSSGDPAILIAGREQIFLIRLGDPWWTVILLPVRHVGRARETVHHEGRFYCLLESGSFFVVVNAPREPTLEFLRMDASQLLPLMQGQTCRLAEIGGDMLLANTVVVWDCCRSLAHGFRVFRADLLKRKWVKIDMTSNRVGCSWELHSVSTLMACNEKFRVCGTMEIVVGRMMQWRLFELGTEGQAYMALLDRDLALIFDKNQLRKHPLYWIVPHLC